ncbi:MAG TPA: hypothetical protein VFB85_02225, partial [Vicinamibacterales bacterium]|nr:hypothetical protein [Vicinamibacterales bacterium]
MAPVPYPLRAAAPLAFLIAVACGAPPQATAPSASTLPPAALPDLSRSEPTVRQQITERYEALQTLRANAGTGRTELAQTYGEVGSLLLAAEYADAAEAFYLNAESIADSDVRWPYYLGHVYMAKSDATRAIAAFERARRLQP